MARRFDVVAYLKLFRFPLVFTAIADSAAGHILASGAVNWRMGCLAIASAGLYFFGMSLNDIADRKRDQELAPGRMLPSGRLSLRSASIACAASLAISLTALVFVSNQPLFPRLAMWGLVVFFIASYDLFLKIPPAMGLVRAGNVMMGILASLPPEEVRIYWYYVVGFGVPSFVYVTALTYVSTLEDAAPNRRRVFIGAAFMIIGAGLAGGIQAVTGIVRDFCYFGHLYTDSVDVFHYTESYWRPVPFTALLGGWIVYRAWKAVDRKGIMLMIRDGVGGIILLDAALVSTHSDYGMAWALAALVIPAAVSVAIFKKLA